MREQINRWWTLGSQEPLNLILKSNTNLTIIGDFDIRSPVRPLLPPIEATAEVALAYLRANPHRIRQT